MHANLCMHILASTCQDGGNPFPVIGLPVVNSVTDSSQHTLLLPALHSQWSRQVYIIHQSITGFLVVQEPTCTHAHEYRLLGASCSVTFLRGQLSSESKDSFHKTKSSARVLLNCRPTAVKRLRQFFLPISRDQFIRDKLKI